MQSRRLSFCRPSRLPYIAVSERVPPPVVVMATTGTCSAQQGTGSKSRARVRHTQPSLRKSDNRLQALIQAEMVLGILGKGCDCCRRLVCHHLTAARRKAHVLPAQMGWEAVYLTCNWKSISSPWNFSQSVLLEAVIENTGFTTPEQIKDL